MPTEVVDLEKGLEFKYSKIHAILLNKYTIACLNHCTHVTMI